VPNKKRVRKELQQAVKSAEEKALEMLVELFDWLDGLEPQPTTEIVALYEKSHAIESKITNTLAQMDQASVKMAEINKLMEEIQKKSVVSFLPYVHLASQFLCSLDVGHRCFCQVREDHKYASLEAGAHFYSQLPLHHARLLFHLRCETFRRRCFATFCEAVFVVL
jgi:hypothetical protein